MFRSKDSGLFLGGAKNEREIPAGMEMRPFQGREPAYRAEFDSPQPLHIRVSDLAANVG